MTDTGEGDIEVGQDIVAQKKLWIFQKFGIVFMALLVAASVLGLLGPGLYSKVESGDPNNFKIEYQRNIHHRSSTEIKIEVSPAQVNGGKTSLALSREYVEKVNIEKVMPEPEKVEVSGDRYEYTFATSEADKPLLVIFYIEASKRGRIEGEVLGTSGEPLRISQFVLP